MPISDRHESFMPEPPRMPPPPGRLTPSYQPPSAGDLFSKLAQLAADPRNAWIGAPGKFVQGAAMLPLLMGALRIGEHGPQFLDAGGAKFPWQRLAGTSPQTHAQGLESAHEFAEKLTSANPMHRLAAQEELDKISRQNGLIFEGWVDKTATGLQGLKAERDLAKYAPTGGSALPSWATDPDYLKHVILNHYRRTLSGGERLADPDAPKGRP